MSRQPTLYVTHGAGPCFWMTFPEPFGPHGFDSLKAYFSGVLDSLPERPRAILVASAHWEERVPTLSTSAAPSMIYDYQGFPAHTYQLKYPAPGSPELALRAQGLLKEAGLDAATDDRRGFDHGVFVPMMIIEPTATIPVVSLSLGNDLDAARHLAIGSALAPLRDEGVLIVASGSSYHNLRAIFGGDGQASMEFDAWLGETVAQTSGDRNARLAHWTSAPSARAAHPREEHLIPLMIAAGAAGEDTGRAEFRDVIGGKTYSCFAFGAT